MGSRSATVLRAKPDETASAGLAHESMLPHSALIERERHVLGQIAAGVPVGQVLEELLRAVEGQSRDGMLTSVLFLSDDGRHMLHGAAPSLPQAYSAAIDGIAIGEGVGSCGTAAARGTPVYAVDIASDPLWSDFRGLALQHGLRACWSTPIKAANGAILGTFAIYYGQPRAPTAEDIEAISVVAQTTALAIERHLFDRALRRSQDELLRLNQILEQQIKERTRALHASMARQQALFDTSRQLMGVIDLDGTLLEGNRAAFDAIGGHRDGVIGQPFWTTPWFSRTAGMEDVVRGGLEAAKNGISARVEMALELPDGSTRVYDFAMHPVRDESGTITEVMPEATDITDLRHAEDALRQSQKMEAVGQLTGGLAHDFNNLLAGISGSLELMQTRLQQGRFNDVERYMVAAQGASKRAAALTHRLLAFSRRQTLDPKPTNVDRLVADMQELIQRTVGPAIPIEVVGTSGIWPALVDPPQLENALLNLCINARDAMPDGGRITIETANKWLDERAARQHDMPEGQYLSLCVTDTGTGMPPEVIARVFEPFFTTKPLGQGTGLGLSMIYGFAQQSGGQVRIYSEVGKGTTVCIYLPRHYGEADAAAGPIEAAPLPRSDQGETVLIVDDESTVRMLVADILADLGYTAIEAGDSAAGLKLLQSDVRTDLLVTDVGLPGGMNGRQMADAGRSVRPALKVLFITGYAENAVVGNGHLAPGMAVLTKPFAVDTMAARIRSMIQA